MSRIGKKIRRKARCWSAARNLADAFGYPERIFSKRRFRDLALKRGHIACVLRADGYSYPEIGFAFSRDHSSIIYLERKWRDQL